MMYLADDGDVATIHMSGSKAGAPTLPHWYYNLNPASLARVEVGADTYEVSVSELTGEERDCVFEERGRRYPGFAESAEETVGIRTIPVLAPRPRLQRGRTSR